MFSVIGSRCEVHYRLESRQTWTTARLNCLGRSCDRPALHSLDCGAQSRCLKPGQHAFSLSITGDASLSRLIVMAKQQPVLDL